jgi:hypothetical protein
MVCQAKIEMSYVLILYALLSFLVVSGKNCGGRCDQALLMPNPPLIVRLVPENCNVLCD